MTVLDHGAESVYLGIHRTKGGVSLHSERVNRANTANKFSNPVEL